MENDVLEKQLKSEWESLLASNNLPDAAGFANRPPGRYAIFAALEEAREIIAGWRSSGVFELKQDRFINSKWSLRDLLSHMASWAREIRSQVETAAAGKGFDYTIPFALTVMGSSAWNQKEVHKRNHYSVADALMEFEKETELLQDLILELPVEILNAPADFPMSPSGDPEGRFKGTIAVIAFLQTRHYAYHLHQIQARMKPDNKPSTED